MPASIQVRHADITTLAVDIVVSSASPTLIGAGGVEGAIHRKAGPLLLAACKAHGGCEVGHAKLTGACGLPSRYVIHAVGPVWQGGRRGEREQLASCYRESLELAVDAGATSIAFPCISTGLHGYPARLAAAVAVDTVRACTEEIARLREVLFCCFTLADYQHYSRLLRRRPLTAGPPWLEREAAE